MLIKGSFDSVDVASDLFILKTSPPPQHGLSSRVYIISTQHHFYFPKHFNQLFRAFTNNATGVALPGNEVTERKS